MAADLAALLGSTAFLGAITKSEYGPLEVALAALVMVVVGKLSGTYDRALDRLTSRALDELPQVLGVVSAATATVAFSSNISGHALLGFLVCVTAIAFLLRIVVRTAGGRLLPPERCLVIGDESSARMLAQRLAEEPSARAEIACHLLPPEPVVAGGNLTLEDLRHVEAEIELLRIDRVVVAQGAQSGTQAGVDLIRYAKSLGVRVSVIPRLFEVLGASVRFEEVQGLTLLGVPSFGLSRTSQLAKRGIDLVGAVLGLIAVAPALALIAIVVRLDSAGPILFRQPRVGRDGCRFSLFKFRTMVADADARKHELLTRNEAGAMFKIADDPRVTRVGRLLRRTSLDELPQLFNVLRGEMSLVGPRPLVLSEDELIRGWDRRRLHLKPGMTGPWQVLSGFRVPLDEMVKLDYRYVGGWSLWGDIKILIRTVVHIVRGHGL